MNNPEDLIQSHLMRSFDAMFQTNAWDGQIPLNLSVYPKSDAQLDLDQQAHERRQDLEDLTDCGERGELP